MMLYLGNALLAHCLHSVHLCLLPSDKWDLGRLVTALAWKSKYRRFNILWSSRVDSAFAHHMAVANEWQ